MENRQRPQVFIPPQTSKAFRTRTPGFLGGTGRTRDAASPGLQAGVTGPAGARNNRGRPFANPQTSNQMAQQISQLQGNPNAGVADLSKSIRPHTGLGPPPTGISPPQQPIRDVAITGRPEPIGASVPLQPPQQLRPLPESTKYARPLTPPAQQQRRGWGVRPNTARPTATQQLTRMRGVYSGR